MDRNASVKPYIKNIFVFRKVLRSRSRVGSGIAPPEFVTYRSPSTAFWGHCNLASRTHSVGIPAKPVIW